MGTSNSGIFDENNKGDRGLLERGEGHKPGVVSKVLGQLPQSLIVVLVNTALDDLSRAGLACHNNPLQASPSSGAHRLIDHASEGLTDKLQRSGADR